MKVMRSGGFAHVVLRDRLDPYLAQDTYVVQEDSFFFLYKDGVVIREWWLGNSNTILCYFEDAPSILINSIAARTLMDILDSAEKYT